MRAVKALILAICTASLLYASMNDGQALAKVRKTYGIRAGLSTLRIGLQGNWDDIIILSTPMCNAENTILGYGGATWESAFDDLNARLASGKWQIGGPFSAPASVQALYPDMASVVSVETYLDGNLIPSVLTHVVTGGVTDSNGNPTAPATPTQTVSWNITPSGLTTGLHALCTVSTDFYGSRVQRQVAVFAVDPNAPASNSGDGIPVTPVVPLDPAAGAKLMISNSPLAMLEITKWIQ